jgi:hypothetical protein
MTGLRFRAVRSRSNPPSCYIARPPVADGLLRHRSPPTRIHATPTSNARVLTAREAHLVRLRERYSRHRPALRSLRLSRGSVGVDCRIFAMRKYARSEPPTGGTLNPATLPVAEQSGHDPGSADCRFRGLRSSDWSDGSCGLSAAAPHSVAGKARRQPTGAPPGTEETASLPLEDLGPLDEVHAIDQRVITLLGPTLSVDAEIVAVTQVAREATRADGSYRVPRYNPLRRRADIDSPVDTSAKRAGIPLVCC